jgi:hypothetical protein
VSLEIRAADEPRTFKLSELTLDTALLLRPLDESTAQEYADVLKAKKELPEISIMRVDSVWLVIDGQHRFRAHQIAKRDRIVCKVLDGTTRADALIASAGANSAHGRPRTVEHRRAAVLALHSQPEWKDKSARWLAEMCNVSPTFAAETIRTVHGGQLPESQGRDGKTRKAPKKTKRKPFDGAKQVKALARTIDQLAKKWPTDEPVQPLLELLFARAADLEKRKRPAAAE